MHVAALPPSRRIKVGYVPLLDCAPLIAARELGIFDRHGLDVRLSREAGWATVREKLLHGELDAAHAPASMVFEMTHGLGGVVPVPSLTGLVLAHHGNAIVVSNRLRDLGVHDAPSLRAALAGSPLGRRPVFASVLRYSSQHYILLDWLRSGGVEPGRDVDVVVVPPPLVADCMAEGRIDGYCVAEPWGSVGLLRGGGHGVALSADLAPGHPEKIFLVRADFHRDRPEEHLRLLASMIESGRWCDHRPNRAGLATLLASRDYLGVPVPALKNALVGPFQLAPGRFAPTREAILFHHGGIDRPSPEKARWLIAALRRHGLADGLPDLPDDALAAPLFRADLYDQAAPLARLLAPAAEAAVAPARQTRRAPAPVA
jgi:ABC-type nitrate/sulfonate/bicarbonate transport system substrate-binding protein